MLKTLLAAALLAAAAVVAPQPSGNSATERHEQLANAAADSGDMLSAAVHMEAASAAAPDSIAVARNTAYLYYSLKDPASAIAHFERAVELHGTERSGKESGLHARGALLDCQVQLGRLAAARTQCQAIMQPLLKRGLAAAGTAGDARHFVRVSSCHCMILLFKLGRLKAQAALFRKLTAKFEFLDWELPLQLPTNVYAPGLAARPFWEASEVKFARQLEKQHAVIQRELDAFLASTNGASWDLDDSEDIVSVLAANATGTPRLKLWTEMTLMHYPRRFNATNCRSFPKTCAFLRKAKALTAEIDGEVVDGEAEFLRLSPGAVLNPHSGSSNLHLHAHLGMRVPGGCELSVGSERGGWEEGKVTVFDDSFIHSVDCTKMGKGGGDRIVLHVTFHHPDRMKRATKWRPRRDEL